MEKLFQNGSCFIFKESKMQICNVKDLEVLQWLNDIVFMYNWAAVYPCLYVLNHSFFFMAILVEKL